MRTARWGAVALLTVLAACGESSRRDALVPGPTAGYTAVGRAGGEANGSRPANRGGWTATPLSGIPAEAQLWDVAMRDGVFVATGELPGSGSDDAMMGVWRSTDGVAWAEVHREEYLQNIDGPPPARVASGPSGFAVVGASCDTHCRPLALTSADGRAWVPGDVRRRPGLRGGTAARLLRGTPDVAYEGAALLDVIDSGGWLAVGWTQAGGYDAEPAVWRTRDAGATWEPLPPEAIPPGGRRADHMERVIAWSGYLLVSGISHDESGGISDLLWLSAGGNQWRSVPAPAAWRLSGMASLLSGEVSLAGSSSEFEGAVWSSEREGEWQRSNDPGLAGLQWVSGLESGRTGLVLLGAERGAEASSAGVSALWGSPDGVHWLQTLRLEEPSPAWAAAMPTEDRWFVYAWTGEGPQRRHVVWTATPRCATAAAVCPAK